MNIGEASKASGVSSKMIRHYESIHLITQSRRTDSGYRTYSSQDVLVLKFIKSARNLGFSLEQIKHLLGLWQDPSRASADVKNLALQHIEQLNAKIAELQQMRDLLQNLTAPCPGDKQPNCPILSGLAQTPR